ncbi:MAG TPA: FtsW/RodA/SpoVE family cell cycle protein [Mycobacteriales bacterium]|nr:FtsW/RodA/SpoVE family cell cycle protein [Mycobacteriales bacterium]
MTAETIARSPRRTGELQLLGVALVVALAAYAAVSLAHDDRIDGSLVKYGAGLAALFAVAHLAVRRLAPAADPVLLPLAAALNGLGLAMVRRLDLAALDTARQRGRPDPAALAPRQLLWTAVGVVVFVAVLAVVRDHRTLDRYRYTAMALGLTLLLLPALPVIGTEINGARIWIRVGSLQFQPAEIAKLCLITFFASYLVAKREVLSLASRRVAGLNVPRARDLGPVVLAWLASLLVLVREKDLGSSLLFFGLFIVMLYIATERTSWLLIGLALFSVGTFVAFVAFGHVRQRIDTWLDPFADAAGSGFQLTQALFGMATGGIFGSGLGRGRPDAVPEAETDFIFASIGEELGLIGVVAVLAVYALIVARGVRVGLGVRDDFGKLFAGGLAFAVGLQVFVVAGGVTRLIPLTGITLPFVSYGGSSLVANYALIALLLRISDAGRGADPTVPPPVPREELTGELTQVVRR